MNSQLIHKCFQNLKFSSHAKQEMLSEEFGVIRESDIREALRGDEIIQAYPTDRPYPGCLILGFTDKGRPLHIVCAPVEEESTLIIITVYEPHPDRWIGHRRRRT